MTVAPCCRIKNMLRKSLTQLLTSIGFGEQWNADSRTRWHTCWGPCTAPPQSLQGHLSQQVAAALSLKCAALISNSAAAPWDKNLRCSIIFPWQGPDNMRILVPTCFACMDNLHLCVHTLSLIVLQPGNNLASCFFTGDQEAGMDGHHSQLAAHRHPLPSR